jgi:K+/H+ antiporter YhaU regulatory subunit KhtT
MVGEGTEFFSVTVPGRLEGQTLAGSGIGAKTGLVVIAIEDGGKTMTNPSSATVLNSSARLLMLGTNQQRERFAETFG